MRTRYRPSTIFSNLIRQDKEQKVTNVMFEAENIEVIISKWSGREHYLNKSELSFQKVVETL